jgi:tryptophan synthase alpha subunit
MFNIFGILNRIMKVSVVGVTGARATVNPRVEDLLKEIRQVRRCEI